MSGSELNGKRILLTRPESQSKLWAESLRSLGAQPIIFPLIEVAPVEHSAEIDRALSDLPATDILVFTSANAVRYFFKILFESGLSLPDCIKVYAIGPATAAELNYYGIRSLELSVSVTSLQLGERMGDVSGKHILIPTTPMASTELTVALERKGALVRPLIVYNTQKRTGGTEELSHLLSEQVEVITFASPSAIEAFKALYGSKPKHSLIACIGPSTAQKAVSLGLIPDIIAENYTTDGLTEAIKNYFKYDKQTTPAAGKR